MNRLSYLWVALVFFWFSADAHTEQSAVTKAEQSQDLPPAVSPFPPTDSPKPPLVTPFDSDQAKALQKAWAGHLGVPVQITDSVSIKFNLIPPGEFVMGSPESELGRWENEDQSRGGRYFLKTIKENEIQHLVKITKPFFLGVYEVTQAQYERVMGNNPSVDKGATKPVGGVYWNRLFGKDFAVEFFRKLSNQEGVEYRLPTEAEWEYACRAGTTTAYSFGDDVSQLGEYAWYDANSKFTVHPVGELKPNAWGLFDMHGNVWEWCQDWFGPYDLQVVNDPTGSPDAFTRKHVRRGGAFFIRPLLVRAAFRNYNLPAYRASTIGFRLARTIPLSP